MVIFSLVANYCFGQIKEAEKNHQYEPTPFSIPVMDHIASFEGKKAPDFMVKDINGYERSISQFLGNNLCLIFLDSQPIPENINSFLETAITQEYKILVVYNNSKDQCKSYPGVPVIANGRFIGEAIYGQELGTPRAFLIDKKGIVRKVLLSVELGEVTNVEDLINSYLF